MASKIVMAEPSRKLGSRNRLKSSFGPFAGHREGNQTSGLLHPGKGVQRKMDAFRPDEKAAGKSPQGFLGCPAKKNFSVF
ncbi:hypothetical protein EBT23_02715 [bacterium]|nr:hypothetical protein [bacterium]